MDDDLQIERDGARIFSIDPVSLDFLVGAEIDFVDDLIGASFKVNNPNATSSCGCGTSFPPGVSPSFAGGRHSPCACACGPFRC